MISKHLPGWLAGAAILAMAAPAAAQTGAITVPAQPLGQAVAALSARTGTPITLAPGVAGTIATNGVAAAAGEAEALDALLGGTGLSWRRAGGGIEITGSSAGAEAGERTLRALRIEGTQGSGDGPFADLSGYGIGAGANGSTDVTATEGTGSLAPNGTSVASKLPLTLRQTPQTVAVLTSEQLKQQNLTDVTGALNAMPGVTVLYGAFNTPTFVSRGFLVNSYQVDGGPIQQFGAGGSGIGTPDLSSYDHVEILRGSGALYGGANDPGGVLNLQRKRPVDRVQLIVDGQGGSYRNYRGSVDLSSPVAFDDHLRARGVAVYQNRDFFYDFTSCDQVNLYGILEADLGSATIVRGGMRWERRDESAPNSIGQPRFADGADLRQPRSRNYTADWARNDAIQSELFAQADHKFANDWKLNLNINRTILKNLLRTPDIRGLDVSPADPVLTYLSNDTLDSSQRSFTVGGTLTGDFTLFGRKQSFVVGGEYLRSRSYSLLSQQLPLDGGFTFPISPFDASRIPPPLDAPTDFDSTFLNTRKQLAGYVSLLLEPLAGVHVNGGVRYSNLKIASRDILAIPSFEIFEDTSRKVTYRNNVVPSLGVTVDLTKTVSIYGNFAETFDATSIFLTPDNDLLAPRSGRTLEGGVKAASPDNTLNLSLAYFDTEQSNLPVLLFRSTRGNCCFAGGGKIKAYGIDFQISGAVTDSLQMNGGYTFTRNRYNGAYNLFLRGSTFPLEQSQQPEHQVKGWAAWVLPGDLNAFTLNGGIRYESKRSQRGVLCGTDRLNCTTPVPFAFSMKGYAVGDVRLAYRPDPHWELALSVTNVTDTRYYATVSNPLNGNFYGEPRQFLATFRAQY